MDINEIILALQTRGPAYTEADLLFRFQAKEIPNCGRAILPDVFRALGYRVGVEVGVYRGEFNEHLCHSLPDATVIAVDAWETGYDHCFTDQDAISDNERMTRERLAKYPNSVILKCSSLTAAAMFPPKSLDFVYIDADHRFVSVVQDMAAWTSRIRPGGMLAGHDYIQYAQRVPSHVPTAVAGFCMAYSINPCCVLGSRHGDKTQRDKYRSWCFIVPNRPDYVYRPEQNESL